MAIPPHGQDASASEPGRAAGGRRSRRSWLTLSIAIAGIAASLSLYLALRSQETRRIEGEFRRDAEQWVGSIERQIEQDMGAIHALKALFAASEGVERREFRVFAEHLLKSHPSLQALEWALRVPADERAAHEEATRQEGIADYQITQQSPAGDMVLAERREEYFPVHLLAPLAGNEQALGFDLGSEPIRAAALAEARRSGRATATGPIPLVQKPVDSAGVLICEPVYVDDGLTAQPPGERVAPAGFVICVLHLKAVAERAVSSSGEASIRAQLVDETVAGQERTFLVYPAQPGSSPFGSLAGRPLPAEEGFRHQIPLRVPGRRWTAYLSPRNGYVADRRSYAPLVALLVGLTVTGLVTMNVGNVVERNRRVEAMVQERTAEVNRANQSLRRQVTERERAEELFRGLLEAAPDAVILVNGNGKIRLVNAVAEQLFGYTRQELVGQPIEVVVPHRFQGRHRNQREQYQQNPHVRPMGAGYELIGLRKDGSEFPAEVSLGPLHTDQGVLVISVVRDITERKRVATERRHREVQMTAARRIQEHLLPKDPPVLPGLDLAGRLYPVEFAAGDHFDFLPLPDGSTGIVVGDVTGHGFASALLMASTSALLKSFAQAGSEIGRILGRVNSVLCRTTEDDRFVTLLFAQFDAEQRSLQFTSAGHPTGYVIDAGGRVKSRLDSTAVPLGVMPETEFATQGPVPLEDGDTVLLLTDGVLEVLSPGGDLFGEERLLTTVRDHRHLPASEIIARLHQSLLEFAGDRKVADDVTAVVVKVEANGRG